MTTAIQSPMKIPIDVPAKTNPNLFGSLGVM
jgi:hypothetical protein